VKMATPQEIAKATDEILTAAYSQLGVPYVYGGEAPGVGFDCSGLTQWCCAQAGIAIPRGSADQFNLSTVKVGGINKPGDLVYFYGGEASGPRPGHVGIAIGTGRMIDAPYTGVDVRFDSYSPTRQIGPMDYYGATRPALLVSGGGGGSGGGSVCNVTLRVLKSGDNGADVRSLQALLNYWHSA